MMMSVFLKKFTQNNKKTSEEEYKKLLKIGLNHAKINSVLYGLENNNPNFSLAYSYYKAIREVDLDIKMVPVKEKVKV